MKEIKYRSIWQVMNATNNIEDKYTTIEHLVDDLILEAIEEAYDNRNNMPIIKMPKLPIV